MRKLIHAVAVMTLATLVLAIGASPASAHEFRKIGRYNFVVGWGDEPAISGFKNSVQMILATASNERPVVDLKDTMKVEVIIGTQTTTYTFEPFFEVGEFGTPGDYRAFFTPTQAGEYAFHLRGTIGNQTVDVRFTCGEQTFDCLEDQTETQFPVKVPSGSELKERIDREVPRLASASASAKDSADQGMLFGIIGMGLGGLALITGPLWGRRARKQA